MNQKLTNKEFIDRAINVHGYKYDYSLVEYVNNKTKVKIICPEHGEFLQQSYGHLVGYGCQKCGIQKSDTQEEFINKANLKHNNKYDYSKVNYIKSDLKVTITCIIHGVFSQKPNSHLRGAGCSSCSGNIKSTTEEFIIKSNKIHNNLYDYSNVIYKGNKIKVDIICNKHGIFSQKPNHHLRGDNCPKCAGKYKTNEEIIKQFNEVHGDLYDYSLIKYEHPTKKLKIICKKHGIFEQKFNSHLSGNGCIVCSGNKKSNTKEFIEKAILIHGSKYIYDLVDYKNSKIKVKIICEKHGTFEQKPNCHLSGQGCSCCKSSKGETKIRIYLEKLNINFESEKKFDNCINPKTNYKLPFDFYLPDYNLCIEYDGKQHFEYWNRWKNDVEYCRIKDEIKNKYAKDSDISLLRIKYTNFNNIDRILQKTLSEYIY